MSIHPTAIISPFAILDKTNPKGIFIGEKTFITRGVIVLSHDFARSICCHTKIGNNVFVGINSVILPGIEIGDNVIIGIGSIVTGNIPSNCVAAGNPCRVIENDVKINEYGKKNYGNLSESDG